MADELSTSKCPVKNLCGKIVKSAQMKIRKTSESPKDKKIKKRRCSSPVEIAECNADWSSEEIVSPGSNSQLDFVSTSDHSSIPSNPSKKDYTDSLLGITDSPVPSTSCYMSSPYPSENSRPDAEHTLAIEEAGIDLCNEYIMQYYESFDTFNQQHPQSLQASYSVVDSQFTLTYEHMSDEDLFSNMMTKNMVTFNMNQIQPEMKPQIEDEKKSEWLFPEDTDVDNISGVVDGICRNLEMDYDQMQVNTVIEQIDQDGIDLDNTDDIITDSLLNDEIPTENSDQTEISQPVHTSPCKTVTLLAENKSAIINVKSPIINEARNDKVVVQKVNIENLPTVQKGTYDIVSEHKYEQKVPFINNLEKTPDKRISKKSSIPKEQEVPKKKLTPEKLTKEQVIQKQALHSGNNTDKQPPLEGKSSVTFNAKKYTNSADIKHKVQEKNRKEEILPPSKFYKSSVLPQVKDSKSVPKSTSKAEELFDLVKNSSIDNIKEPSNTFDIYMPRQAFKHASRKIQEEFKTQTRKRKPSEEMARPVIKCVKRDCFKSASVRDTTRSGAKQKDYKLFAVEVEPRTSCSSRTPGSLGSTFSTRVPNKENNNMLKKRQNKSNDDAWLSNPLIMANLERFKQVKKI